MRLWVHKANGLILHFGYQRIKYTKDSQQIPEIFMSG